MESTAVKKNEAQDTGSAQKLSPTRRKLCVALLVLLGFSLGATEFVVIGIESELAGEFGVSLSTVGQLVSMFAMPYAIMTPVLALSTGRFKRYTLLCTYGAIFVAGNLLMALAPSFGVLLAARIVLGSVSGALLALGVTYIPELVEPKRASMMLAIVYAAFSVAMVVVTSLGKILADTVGWHVAMDGTLALAVVTCGLLLAFMPRSGSTDEPSTFGEQAALLREPSIITGMLIFLFGIGSVYVFYGYITPYLEQVLGMGTLEASTTLMAYGMFCLLSNILGGWIDTRFGMPALVPLFIVQAFVLLGLYLTGSAMPMALILVFCVATLMYLYSVAVISMFMRVARNRHPKAMTLASSLEPLSFNLGISFGTAIGGGVVATWGLGSVGLVGAALSLVACAFVALTIRLDKRASKAPQA